MHLKSETEPRVGDAMWWRWHAASVAPNPRVLLLVTIGWVTELALLGCASDNIYYVSRPAQWLAVIFAAWIWVTMGWVVWLVASRLRHPLARNLESTICGRGRGEPVRCGDRPRRNGRPEYGAPRTGAFATRGSADMAAAVGVLSVPNVLECYFPPLPPSILTLAR